MKFPLLFPESASTTAPQIDLLYWGLVAVSLFFLTIIFLPMAYFLVKYRKGKVAYRGPVGISTLFM
jgi:heme/copper-type cytochrome/quinol oxidase subunit 2